MRTFTICIDINIKTAIKKLPRCLTPVCHDITLPSNLTCSVSLTNFPYLIQIVFCALKVITLLVAKSLQIFIILFKPYTLGQPRVISSV